MDKNVSAVRQSEMHHQISESLVSGTKTASILDLQNNYKNLF